MSPPPVALLTLVQTSRECLSYRLMVDGAAIWTTRAFAGELQSRLDARARMAAWAARHGVEVIDDTGAVLVAAVPPACAECGGTGRVFLRKRGMAIVAEEVCPACKGVQS